MGNNNNNLMVGYRYPALAHACTPGRVPAPDLMSATLLPWPCACR